MFVYAHTVYLCEQVWFVCVLWLCNVAVSSDGSLRCNLRGDFENSSSGKMGIVSLLPDLTLSAAGTLQLIFKNTYISS